MRGVALKVAYNDGGAAPGGLIGYRGICSDGVILDNVRKRRMTNCADPNGPCCTFVSNNFTGHRPSIDSREPWCYESTLLSRKPWKFGAGVYHNGERQGQPIPIRQISTGDVAILTTLKPGTREPSRFIFAIFRIGHISNDPHSGAMLVSDSTLDVRLPDDVAPLLQFWRYHSNKQGPPDWRTGLFRYLAVDETTTILSEIMGGLGDRIERDLIYEALDRKVLPRLPGTGGAECLQRPEGPEHRQLKERVAADPTLIGLPSSAKAQVEHVFLYTCDRVDILFELVNGTAAVVEIETRLPLPGAHQCVKYRALLEAERGLALNTDKVQAILVAYSFDQETEAFAKQYGIRLVTLPP